MFHWICPECGREIAPTAKECPACDPVAASATASSLEVVSEIPAPVEEVPVLTPEIVGLATSPADAAPVPPVSVPVELPRLMEAVAPVAIESPKPFEPELTMLPAPVAPKALLLAPESPVAEPEPKIQARVEPPAPPAPVSALPLPTALAPEPEPVAAEQVLLPNPTAALPATDLPQASSVPHAGLREPQPQAPQSSTIESLCTEEAFPPAMPLRVPAPKGGFTPAPMVAGVQHNSRISVAAIEPATGERSIAGSEPQANLSVPGPVLPHELTSLHAAGVARMLPLNAAAQASHKRGWMVSAAVASGFLALALAAVFYAMPTLAEPSSANSKAEPAPRQVAVVPEPPPAPARKSPRELEVTGVRFVTDLPDRGPQIQYIVVNHSNAPLNGVVVNVTLRATASQSPLSQFSFRTPRLGPYESKEMISTIERLNRPLDLPDWREVEAEVEISK